MRQQFLEWMDSDNVVQIEDNLYVEQCSLYNIKMSKFIMYRYFIKEFWVEPYF